MPQLILILIGGGSHSGKQTISSSLQRTLTTSTPSLQTKILSLDTDYLVANAESMPLGPGMYDFLRLRDDVERLRKEVENNGNDSDLIVLIPGKYALYNDELLGQASLKIFIDCDPDTRLSRWLLQDVVGDSSLNKQEKDQKFKDVVEKYLGEVRNEYDEWINKTRCKADVILQNENNRFLESSSSSSSSDAINDNEGEDIIVSLLSDGILPVLKQRVFIKDDMIERRSSYAALNGNGGGNGSGFNFNFKGEAFDVEKERFYDLS